MLTRLLFIMLIAGVLALIGLSYISRATTSSPGSSPRLGVVQEAGVIKGRVLYADGRPVSGARVYAMKSDLAIGRLPGAETDEQGEFLFQNLSPGTYTVSASKKEEGYPPTDSSFYYPDGLNAPQVSVYAGQTISDIVVQFEQPFGKIKGRMVSALDNKPIRGQGIEIILWTDRPNGYFSTGVDTDGNFEVLAPPVPFKIEASAPGFEKWHYRSSNSTNARDYLELAPGASKNLNITLRPIR
jgi:hypothetical protein